MEAHTCRSCRYYRQMGGKTFCYKHDRIVDPPIGCPDYVRKDRPVEHRKRLILEGASKEGAGIEGVGEITVTEKPEGSAGFELPKKGSNDGKLFIDVPVDENLLQIPNDRETVQSERLFLAVLGFGLILLIIALMASGVF